MDDNHVKELMVRLKEGDDAALEEIMDGTERFGKVCP